MSKKLILHTISVSHTLGRIAVENNFITEEQLAECIAIQREKASEGKHVKLGTILSEKGYLTDEQIDLFLDIQIMARRKKSDELYGSIAVRNKIITEAQLKEALREQRKNPGKKLGEILLESGTISIYEHFIILKVQARLKAQEAEEAATIGIDEDEKDFALDTDSITVGRLKENDVFIPDPGISRKHCRFVKTDQGYKVEDLHSVNGIRVNGRLVESALLKPGDKILVGDTLMVIEEELAAELPPEEGEEKKEKVHRKVLKVRYKPRAARVEQRAARRVIGLIAAVIMIGIVAVIAYNAATPPEQTPEERIAQEPTPGPEVGEEWTKAEQLKPRPADLQPIQRRYVERARRGDFSTPERFVRRERIEVPEAEPIPAEEIEPEEAGPSPEQAKATELIAKAKASDLPQKQAIYDKLIALGTPGEEALQSYLLERRGELAKSLINKKLLKAVQRMQLYRLNLFEKRFEALSAIADYKEYTKTKGQPQIDKLVGEVRQAYNLKYQLPRVKFSKSKKQALAELDLTDAYLKKLGAEIPEAYSRYLDLLREVAVRPVGFQEFALEYEDPEVAKKNMVVLQYYGEFKRKFPEITGEEWSFIDTLNNYRILMGRVALVPDERLCKATKKHSSEMMRLNYFSHTSPNPETRMPTDRAMKEDYNQLPVGENILQGMYAGQAVFLGWYNSAPHHRNMLMLRHMHAGIGQEQHLWTANFGAGARGMENYKKLLENKGANK